MSSENLKLNRQDVTIVKEVVGTLAAETSGDVLPKELPYPNRLCEYATSMAANRGE